MPRPVGTVTVALGSATPSSTALFVRIARTIAADIQRGRLGPGARLPGSRSLAQTLGVHRNTVLAAYRELDAQGYLTTRKAGGTFVTSALPEPRATSHAAPRARRQRAATKFTLRGPPPPNATFEPLPRGVIGLYGGVPDTRILPLAAFARAYRRALQKPTNLSYGDPRGHPRLRTELARMLRESRGLALTRDELVVTRGSQMALALAAKSLLAPGDIVAVEALGYRPAWHALHAAGAELIPVPVDPDGLDVDALAALCERRPVRAVYVTPHHQYPTTRLLSAPRRLALLALAQARGLAIFEDDYDHEFHYDGPPVLPLASADAAGNVLYIGTLSKVLAPGVRIGYLAGPPELLNRVVAHRYYLDRQGDAATECAVADLLEDGEVQRHARRARRIYLGRRKTFVDLLRAQLGASLAFDVPVGGMALWARIIGSHDIARLTRRALEEGVAFQPGALFDFAGGAPPYIRLGFAGSTEAELKTAVAAMKRAFEGTGQRRTRR